MEKYLDHNLEEVMPDAGSAAPFRQYQRLPVDEGQLDKVFTYHPPLPDQALRYVEIRDAAKALAACMYALCPRSRELSLAMTKLEEAVMWANASIARNE